MERRTPWVHADDRARGWETRNGRLRARRARVVGKAYKTEYSGAAGTVDGQIRDYCVRSGMGVSQGRTVAR